MRGNWVEVRVKVGQKRQGRARWEPSRRFDSEGGRSGAACTKLGMGDGARARHGRRGRDKDQAMQSRRPQVVLVGRSCSHASTKADPPLIHLAASQPYSSKKIASSSSARGR